MTDATNFEQRLQDAFDRYLSAAPTAVDSPAMAGLARSADAMASLPMIERRARRWSAQIQLQLAIAGLVAVALLAGVLSLAGRQAVLPAPRPTPSATVTATPFPTPFHEPASFGIEPTPDVSLGPIGTPMPVTGYLGVVRVIAGRDPALPTEALVRLADGRVLGLGDSWPQAVPQSIFDPTTGTFTKIGTLTGLRSQPKAIVLRDGRVLIVGGDITPPTGGSAGISGEATSDTAEIFDPADGSFTALGPVGGKRWASDLVMRPDGRVLVIGGIQVGSASGAGSTAVDLFDPATDTFTSMPAVAPPKDARVVDAVVIGSGDVIALTWPPVTALRYDPSTGATTAIALPKLPPHPAGGQAWPVVPAAGIAVADGRIVYPGLDCDEVQYPVADGHTEDWYPTPSLVFDPRTGRFSLGTTMPHCVDTATSLPDGRIFVTGFWRQERPSEWAGILDPRTGVIQETAALPASGPYRQIVGLADGRVLVVTGDVIAVFE